MNLLIVAFWVLVPTLVVGGLIWTAYQERKRKEALESLADELGMSFSETLTSHDLGTLQGFPLGQRGQSQKSSNVMTADSGELRMVVFDYAYTVGGGKNKQRHSQSVVLINSPDLGLPYFSLTPETFLDRMADLFGYRDIDFEDDDDFSRRYCLKGADEEAIRQFFTRERRSRLMKWPTLTMEAAGHSFIFYAPRCRRKLEELREQMEQGFALYSVLRQPEKSGSL
jgi:hypothetical protein